MPAYYAFTKAWLKNNKSYIYLCHHKPHLKKLLDKTRKQTQGVHTAGKWKAQRNQNTDVH